MMTQLISLLFETLVLAISFRPVIFLGSLSTTHRFLPAFQCGRTTMRRPIMGCRQLSDVKFILMFSTLRFGEIPNLV